MSISLQDFVIQGTIVYDMLSRFDGGVVARAGFRFVREKALSVLPVNIRVALALSDGERPKYLSQAPPLA